MSDFLHYCRAHGLVIDRLIHDRWVRVPTTDKPRNRNGAYKYAGPVGWVQNHATMPEVATWRPDGDAGLMVDHEAVRRSMRREAERLAALREGAAKKAHAIVSRTTISRHPYLAAKGFPDAEAMVLKTDESLLLVVPMYVANELAGCQLINADGGKKFLAGQVTKGATFAIGKGDPVFCEGYATALSIHAAMNAARLRRTVVTCFSARNLQFMATTGWVVADNDESHTGERAAQATGQPYWMSDQVGEDFNDHANRVGLFKASQALKLAWIGQRVT